MANKRPANGPLLPNNQYINMGLRVEQQPSPLIPTVPQAPAVPALPAAPTVPGVSKKVYPPSAPLAQVPQYREDYISDYNDPFEINSISDLIWTTFNPDMERTELGGLEDIPGLNIITGFVTELLWKKGLKPITEQGLSGFLTSTKNAWINFMETMDILANPIKGLFLEGGEGFMDAIGYGGDGRKNYDYDSGNLLMDIGGELISDPINWFTLGLKGAVTKGGTKILEEVLQTSFKEVAPDIIKEVAEETFTKVAKKAIKETMEVDGSHLLRKFIKASNGTLQKTPNFAESLVKAVSESQDEALMAFFRDPSNLNKMSTKIKLLMDSGMNDMSIKVLKGLQKTVNFTQRFENILQHSTMYSTIPGLAAFGIMDTTSLVKKFIAESLSRATKVYTNAAGKLDILDASQILDTTETTIRDFNAKLGFAEQMPTEELKNRVIQDAIDSELGALYKLLKEDTQAYQSTDIVGKMKVIEDNIRKKYNLSPEELLSILTRMNTETNGKYSKFIDYFKKVYDLENAAEFKVIDELKFNEVKNGISKRLFDNKALDARSKVSIVNAFVAASHATNKSGIKVSTLSEYIAALEGLNLTGKTKDYFTGYIENLKNINNQLLTQVELQTKYENYFRLAENIKINNKHTQARIQKLELVKNAVENLKYPSSENGQKILNSLIEDVKGMAPNTKIYSGLVEQLENFKKLKVNDTKNTDIDKLLDRVDEHIKRLRNGMSKPVDFSTAKYVTTIEEKLKASAAAQKGNFEYLMNILRKKDKKTGELVYKEFIRYDLDSDTRYIATNFLKKFKSLEDLTDKQEQEIFKSLPEIYREVHDIDPHTLETLKLQDATKQLEILKAYSKTAQDIYDGLMSHKIRIFSEEIILLATQFNQVSPFQQHYYLDAITEDVTELMGKLSEHLTLTEEMLEQSSIDDIAGVVNKILWFSKNTEKDLLLNGVNTPEILNPLRDIISQFEEFLPKTHSELMEQVFNDPDLITIKLGEAYNTAMNLTDAEVIKVFSDILDPDTAIGRVVSNAVYYEQQASKVKVRKSGKAALEVTIKETQEKATKLDTLESTEYPATLLKHAALNFLNIQKLYQAIYDLEGINKNIQDAFLDTLHKPLLAKQNPMAFADEEHLNNTLYYLFQALEDQLYSISYKEPLKLEYIVEHDPAFEAIRKQVASHMAYDDAFATYHVIKEKMPEVFEDDPKIGYLAYDFETTGLSGYQNQIRQVGIYSPDLGDLNAKPIYIAGGEVPEKDLIQKLHPDFFTPEALAKQPDVKQAYIDFYVGGTSEGQALLEMADRINIVGASKPNVVIMGWNNNRFDKSFFNARLKTLLNSGQITEEQYVYMTASFRRCKHIDGLQLYKQKLGYASLLPEEKTTLTELFRGYINSQIKLADDFKKNPLIQPQTLQAIDPHVGDLLKQFARTLQDSKKQVAEFTGENLAMELNTAASHIFNTFHDIGSTNDMLGHLVISKKIFENDAFVAEAGHNMSQALYAIRGDNGTFDILEGFKTYAVRNIKKPSDIQRFFDAPEVLLEETRLHRITDMFLARKQSIKNMVRLESQKQGLYDFLNFIMPIIKQHSTEYPIMNLLKIPADDVKDAYLISEYIYKNAKADLHKVIDNYFTADKTQVEGILARTGIIYKMAFDEEQLNYIKKLDEAIYSKANEIRSEANKAFYKANKSEEQIAKEAQRTGKIQQALDSFDSLTFAEDDFDPERITQDIEFLIQHFTEYTNPLREYTKVLSLNDATRAVTQRRLGVVSKVQELLNLVHDTQKALPDNEAKFAQLIKYRKYSRHLIDQQLHQVLSLSDDQLFDLLAGQAKRIIVFDAGAYISDPAFMDLIAGLKERTELLKQKDIHVFFNGTKVEIILHKDAKIGSAKEIILKELNHGAAAQIFDETDDAVSKALSEARSHLLRISGNAMAGSLGDIMSQTGYKTLYETLSDEAKAILPDLDKMFLNSEMFENTFNFSLLGTPEFRRTVFEYTPSNIMSIYTTSAKYQATAGHALAQYIDLFNNSAMSINSGLLADQSKITDTDLLTALQKAPEYRLVALVQDTHYKYGCGVIEIDPVSPQAIAEARKLNATIMPYQTYSKMVEVINRAKPTQGFLNFWHKYLYLMKSTYLSNPFAWTRNAIDSFIKNIVSTGDIGIAPYYIKAMRLYKGYKEAAVDILKSSGNDVSLAKKYIDLYFDQINKTGRITKEEFFDMYNFIQDSASAGDPRVITHEYYLNRKHAKLLQNGKMGRWAAVSEFTNLMTNPNREIEQISRLAEYLWATQKSGMSDIMANALVAATHFDYGLKTNADHLMELVFPFYTFKMKNLEYWLNAFETKPWLASVFRDIMTPIWNLDDISAEEYEKNKSLEYQLLSGNPVLTKNGVTLKLNPSIMDAINLLSNPYDSIKSSLSAPAQMFYSYFFSCLDKRVESGHTTIGTAIDLLKPMQYQEGVSESDIRNALSTVASVMPFVGPYIQQYVFSGPAYYKRTGNLANLLVPGLFGSVKRWTPQVQTQMGSKSAGTNYTKYHRLKKIRKSYTVYPKFTTPKIKGVKTSAGTLYGSSSYAGKAYPMRFYPRATYYPSFKWPKKMYPQQYHPNNFYNDLYTKTGKSRFKLRMMPVSPRNLKQKIKDMYYFLK